MSLGRYGFMPWMRRGLINKVSQNGNDYTGSAGRATIGVTVKYGRKNDNTTPPNPVTTLGTIPEKSIQILGPIDIVGINPASIIKCEPANGVFDFEANYLPFIEFFEEDFPWRYTPSMPDGMKLRPWITLIVLKDNEYTLHPPSSEDLPASIEIASGVSFDDIFAPVDQQWAWAHVHVNKPTDGVTSAAQLQTDFKNSIDNDPSMACSRLLCPRRLEKSTQYSAFIIPAFETGRLSGLGDEATANITGSLVSSRADTTKRKFPIYHQWRFGTAALGDFETLVRALTPRVTPPEQGGRDMSIADTGMTLDSHVNSANEIVVMEGALKPPAFTPVVPKDNDDTLSAANDGYTSNLAKILNLAADMQDPTVYPTTTPSHPYSFVTNSIQIDPVIVPPVYGQWHADVQKVDANAPLWLQQLNLDPRYRATAGLGAKVVRDNQERFMEMAWKQIGDVLAANDKIAKAQLALAASRRLFAKHVVGDANAISVNVDERYSKAMRASAIALKKIPIHHPAVQQDANLNARVFASKTALTAAPASASFNKTVRTRSTIVRKAGVAVTNKIVTELGKVTSVVKAATSLLPPQANTAAASLTPSNSASSSSTTVYSTSMTVSANNWFLIYNGQLNEFKRTMLYYNQIEAAYLPTAQDLPLFSSFATVSATGLTFIEYVQENLNPDVTITERVRKLIQYQTSTNIGLDPIYAYPVYDIPVYQELIKISPEYLLPKPEGYPNNTVTLLETNTRFIEAFMVGMNHEFSRELLWREYPTDQRGSYFRKFWDLNDTINFTAPSNLEYMFDIAQLHNWPNNNLGDNHQPARHGSNIVLLIKGDFLKKFPNALIYMQKAVQVSGKRKIKITEAEQLTMLDSSGKPKTDEILFPIFKASLQPDITMLGFNIDETTARGSVSGPNFGWFVVFRERPGHLRFGMDEFEGTNPPQMDTWNDLTWAHVSNPTVVNTTPLLLLTAPPEFSPSEDSASIAWILHQQPVIVAIHADDMLP